MTSSPEKSGANNSVTGINCYQRICRAYFFPFPPTLTPTLSLARERRVRAGAGRKQQNSMRSY